MNGRMEIDGLRLDALSGLEVAGSATRELHERHAVAKQAMLDYALRALLDGTDVEQVMDACGIKEPRGGRSGFLSYGPETRRQVLAHALTTEVQRLVMGDEMPEEDDDE